MTSPTHSDLTLGQPVEYTWSLVRQTQYRSVPDDRYQRQQRWKVWGHERYVGQPEPPPTRGILIGIRTLVNGRTEYDYDAGTQFLPDTAERFTAYLVVSHLRRAPVYVLREHLRFLTLTPETADVD